MGRKRIDYTNQRFGKLVAVSYIGGERAQWLCRCDCGKVAVVRSENLRTGKTSSCGCKEFLIHGHKRTNQASRTYLAWCSMKERCTNPNHRAYHRYGGRGVRICDRWMHSFQNFLDDMGEVQEGLSLDRINNNGHYCKENCRWATIKQQSDNRRTTRLLTFRGETMAMKDWAKRIGCASVTLARRLKKWDLERALLTPFERKSR